MEDFTSHQSLATDSFSYSWLTNPSPSFDRLIDESTINEFMISLPVDKDFDFNVVLPESESESKSKSSSESLIHADEIFSGGRILPVYNSISVPATPVVVCSFTGEQRKKRQRFSLRYFRESSNRILKSSFLIFSKLGCSREGVRVDDLSRKVKEIRSRNTSNRTSPEYRRGEAGAGTAGAGAGGKLKAYGSGDFSRKMKKNNGYKDLRSVKSSNNTPWSSPSSQPMNPWQHHVEISIDEAILHCKRSFASN